MRIVLLSILLPLFVTLHGQEFLTECERSGGTCTFTYEAGIQFCEQLDSLSPYISLFTYGKTDAGEPLHLLVFDADKNFNPQTTKEVLLINNAIHPGEPDGVEASLMIMRDLAKNEALRTKYAGVRILVIPFYNIDGAMNRSAHSRANQLGPEEYGFRGSGKNLDLNRDFIKADAANTFAFYLIFHTWNPHVFVDTHVSNGADYPYTMTLIHSQEEKYGDQCAMLLKARFIPGLYARMKARGEEMVPYVNVHGHAPDSGFAAFMETPRFSNGYTTLFDCFSFVSETHMLKSYPSRVAATRLFLEELILLTQEMKPSESIHKDRLARASYASKGVSYAIPYSWEPNGVCDSLPFKGYSAGYMPSEVSGKPRLFYDRGKPFEKNIPFCDEFKVTASGHSVRAYIIPQAWQEVVERLAANGVNIDTLKANDTVKVLQASIESFETGNNPYEGHYVHGRTKVRWTSHTKVFRKGDYRIIPDAKTEAFLANVLQPEAPDSYFNWNFFDAVLQQKEWFSDYVFEDIAAELLRNDPELKAKLETQKAADPVFAASAFEQLYFVYRNSPYFEESFKRYPVYLIPY
ncbi:MAG: M14 family zinc carboxypeptidase [Bacteroidia bacterium]